MIRTLRIERGSRRGKARETITMNYLVTAVVQRISGDWGFSIIDSHIQPLVNFEFAHQDKANKAHLAIVEVVGIATKISNEVIKPRTD